MQVNGKKRADVTVPGDADTVAVEAVVRGPRPCSGPWKAAPIRKIIVVPGRIVNVVV